MTHPEVQAGACQAQGLKEETLPLIHSSKSSCLQPSRQHRDQPVRSVCIQLPLVKWRVAGLFQAYFWSINQCCVYNGTCAVIICSVSVKTQTGIQDAHMQHVVVLCVPN